MKDSKNKPKYSLIYTSMLNEVAKVREQALVTKYPDSEDWRKNESIVHLEAAERHIRKVMDGEVYDEESKLYHCAHAICNLMFEIERFETLKKTTNRGFIKPTKEKGTDK